MPGRIMSAQQAKKEYGTKFRSIRKKGSEISLKNSQGKKISVNKNTKVYHRGKGNFGVYSRSGDAARHRRGAKDRIGKGGMRHTHD